VVGAGLAAVGVGLLGVDGGLVWIVCGVWTVRAAWGHRPGIAWAISCVAGGLHWGTLGVGDVGAAARAVGPALVAGPAVAGVAAALALTGAVMEESLTDGLRARAPAERLAAAVAILTLVAVFGAPGPDPINVAGAIGWWFVAAGALTGLVLAGSRVARLAPGWTPVLVSCSGAVLMAVRR
jgi:hypothetical protein